MPVVSNDIFTHLPSFSTEFSWEDRVWATSREGIKKLEATASTHSMESNKGGFDRFIFIYATNVAKIVIIALHWSY